MKIALSLAALAVLVSCGVAGEPQTPRYSTETSVGYNSKSGPFSKTKFSVEFGG